MKRPKVLVVTGYYDEFSGYLEVSLAEALAELADVTVITGNRVSPAFSEAHLEKLNRARYYSAADTGERVVKVLRFSYSKVSSLLISVRAWRAMHSSGPYDLVVILAPGQLFSIPAGWLVSARSRIVIFGDNRAQWAGLPKLRILLRRALFRHTKGLLYKRLILRCDRVISITPNTRTRLLEIDPKLDSEVTSLPVDGAQYFPSESDRRASRLDLGITDDEFVIGILGKVSPEKELERAIDAIEDGATRGTRLVIAGLSADAYSNAIRARVAASQALARGAILFEYLDASHLASMMRVCDVIVWPVQPAITIQQAMACGTRVLLPANDLVGHLLLDPIQGAYFAEGDWNGLAGLIAGEVAGPMRAGDREKRGRLAATLTADSLARDLLGSHLDGEA